MLKWLSFLFIISVGSFGLAAQTQNFDLIAVEVNGVKFWLPSTITVKKGDTVKIRAISKVPGENSVHGLAIDEYKVEEVATTKGVDVSFVADKAGAFKIRCHMHPPHIGAQLVVLE